MNTTKRLPVFEKFIQDVRAAWAELQDTEARMKRGKSIARRTGEGSNYPGAF